jgi:hypothetical protein
VIAKQGHDAAFLIETREVDGRRHGRVYDRTRNEIFPEMLVASIAARGYWDDFTGSGRARGGSQ